MSLRSTHLFSQNNHNFMPSEIRNAWIKALRSGKYEQGRHVLKDSDAGYCCLGVLCDVIDSSKWEYRPGREFEYQYEGSFEYPPDDVKFKANLTEGACSALASLNDDDELTFNQIANIIENSL